jgi:hydrogenase maturation protein HypF
LDDKNFIKFKKSVLNFLKKNKLKPNIILTDLHPEYRTTLWGKELSKKFKAKHIQIQHHHAHIFSAIGEDLIFNFQSIFNQFSNSNFQFLGIALDGTGYGLNGKIWGGEIFQWSMVNGQWSMVRLGHLENQTMIGGDLAVKEPARMLISILDKFSISNFQFSNNFQFKNLQTKKEFIYNFVKKYYTRNQFELLYNQLEQNFNCVETSSAGRVLDAVSVLLGFSGNKRNYKHEPIDLLEKNSAKPYGDLRPKLQITNKFKIQNSKFILDTTYLFKYLIKNLHKDKKRLAATAQLYIAQGLYEIAKKQENTPLRQGSEGQAKTRKQKIFLAGGLGNNKIISSYLESKGAIANKKVPRGDAGLSFGQIIFYLMGETIETLATTVPSP